MISENVNVFFKKLRFMPFKNLFMNQFFGSRTFKMVYEFFKNVQDFSKNCFLFSKFGHDF
jgi:hypothetical protein